MGRGMTSRSVRGLRRRPFPVRDARGFTLLELMVAVAILAILASLAGPSFSTLIAAQRAKAFGTEFMASLMQTRSEAVMRNTSVMMQPTTSGSLSWQNGWQIVNPNVSNAYIDQRGATAGITVNAYGRNNLTYLASGRILPTTAQVKFVITATVGSSTSSQCVSADLSGRPYMKAGTSC
jgi:type IV fimbrial biogenesis protein FimT